MKRVQLTIELPDDFDSIGQLEATINATGQRVKQKLFESEVHELINKEKPNAKQETCSHCQKKNSSFVVNNPDN